MIFISHNNKDKEFVGPIAEKLSEIYGQEKVFFDTWSIKPGENIITEMNKGLEKTSYFFYFITENSLASEMVDLEWTSALKEKTNRKIKFIPVKADDVAVPIIISAISYLDLYINGLETTISQMIEIINDNYKTSKFPEFTNLQGYVVSKDQDDFSFFIKAKQFFEPSSTFLIVTDYEQDEVEIKIENVPYFTHNFNSDIEVLDYGELDLDKEIKLNGFAVGIPGGLKKGFPIEISFKRIKGHGNFIDLHHAKTKEDFPKIPLKIIDDSSKVTKDL